MLASKPAIVNQASKQNSNWMPAKICKLYNLNFQPANSAVHGICGKLQRCEGSSTLHELPKNTLGLQRPVLWSMHWNERTQIILLVSLRSEWNQPYQKICYKHHLCSMMLILFLPASLASRSFCIASKAVARQFDWASTKSSSLEGCCSSCCEFSTLALSWTSASVEVKLAKPDPDVCTGSDDEAGLPGSSSKPSMYSIVDCAFSWSTDPAVLESCDAHFVSLIFFRRGDDKHSVNQSRSLSSSLSSWRLLDIAQAIKNYLISLPDFFFRIASKVATKA